MKTVLSGVVLVLMILSVPSGFAASFDCKKARTQVEQMICKDTALGTLDEAMAEAYKDAQRRLADTDELRKNQDGWLQTTRNKCDTTACLLDVYQQRIRFLEKQSVVQARPDKAIRDEVNAKVTQLAELLGGYIWGSPDDPGIQVLKHKPDVRTFVVAAFRMHVEMANNYTWFMAVFFVENPTESHPKKLSLLDFIEVGDGRGVDLTESKGMKIEQSKDAIVITVPTLAWRPGDLPCCPSVKSQAQFAIDFSGERRLQKIKRGRGAGLNR